MVKNLSLSLLCYLDFDEWTRQIGPPSTGQVGKAKYFFKCLFYARVVPGISQHRG